MNYPRYSNPQRAEAFRALSLRRPPEVLLVTNATFRGRLIRSIGAPLAGEIWFPHDYDRSDHTVLLRADILDRLAAEHYVDAECLTMPEPVDLSDVEAVNRWLG